jgi:hypothetical protein
VKSGAPQGSVMLALLCLIYTADLPKTNNTTIATFVDDSALIAVNNDPIVTSHLQYHLSFLHEWYSKWKIKINQTKSVQVALTTKRTTCPQATINNMQIPIRTEVKSLELYLDKKLAWQKQSVRI